MDLVMVSENRVSFVDGVAEQALLPGLNRCVDFLNELGVCGCLGRKRNSRQDTDQDTEEKGGAGLSKPGRFFVKLWENRRALRPQCINLLLPGGDLSWYRKLRK
jgi:hypothetical protein